MLPTPFREFFALLNAHGVDYLLVGGHAVAVHGYPRNTGDLDVFVGVSPESAVRLVRVFAAFGFGDLGLRKEDFLEEDQVIEIGREPLKIQVLTGISGVTFAECWPQRILVEDDGLQIPVIGYEALLRNKRATHRPRDEVDADELERRNRPDSRE